MNQHLHPMDSKLHSFGRHETFALRFGWLTKGFQGITDNSRLFLLDGATVQLGVGKNMVASIRYWMKASRIAIASGSEIKGTGIGKAIFSNNGWDPYLEDEATLWLLHWLIASNSPQATSLYWFFNYFHKPEFSPEEIVNGIKEFASEHLTGEKVVESTIKHDCQMLIRLYVPSKVDKKTPVEEALDSPLSMLGLIDKHEYSNRFVSAPKARWEIPLGVIGFALEELFDADGQSSLPLEVIMHGNKVLPGIGSIFRLTEECMMTKIEELMSWFPGTFELRESAGIHLLYQLEKVRPIAFLKKHYESRLVRIAA